MLTKNRRIPSLLFCVLVAASSPATASMDIFNKQKVATITERLRVTNLEVKALRIKVQELESAEEERLRNLENDQREFEESLARRQDEADHEFEARIKEQENEFEARRKKHGAEYEALTKEQEDEFARLKADFQLEAEKLRQQKSQLELELEIIDRSRKIAEEEVIYVPFAESDRNQSVIPGLITLNIGGRDFKIRKSRFERLSMSPLKAMFGGYFIPGDRLASGAYVMDEDPDLFDHILKWIRYGRIDFRSYKEALLVREVANKWCYDMLPVIDHYLCRNLPKAKLEILELQGQENKNFFICRATDGQVIGNQNYGHSTQGGARPHVNEYCRRTKAGFLCYAWSGHGLKIYNTFNGKAIGQSFKDFKDPKSNLPGLDLISKAVPPYICALNGEDEFAVYNMISGHPVSDGTSFEDVDSCLRYIRTTLSKHLPI